MFKKNKKTRLNRTMFDKSHERKMSIKFGKLYPCFIDEIVPGDTINLKSEMMARLAPMTAPIMHRVDMYIHYFFVPNRILWDSWEDFITGNEELEVPTFTASYDGDRLKKGKLADYLGMPAHDSIAGSDITYSRLPFYAYNKIYNEYYRDQDLQDEVNIAQGELLTRAWTKDYFTSARPWAQKGDAPNLPIVSSVEYMQEAIAYADDPDYYAPADGNMYVSGATSGQHQFGKTIKDGGTGEGDPLGIENIESVTSGLSINDIRTTSAIQQFLEKKARGGSRYAEYLLSIFGVKSSDARLQRPEYLGGGKQPIRISEVLNTSDTANAPQGNMSGHGIGVGETFNVNKFFNEHGIVMGILSVVPKPAYHQGIPKMFSRKDQYDFYLPQFANLGEQEILQQELYFDPTQNADVNEATFAYQSRYADMKYMADSVHGDFRDTLRHWHLSRKFESLTPPALNDEFIECEPETTNIFAAGDTTDYIWIQLYHHYKAIRPMPYFGTPGLTKI